MKPKRNSSQPISNLILLILLISSSTYILLIFHFLRPNYEMLFQSYEQKMEQAYRDKMSMLERGEQNKFEVLNFIKNNAEQDSTVLFFNYTYWIFGFAYLYPSLKCDYIEFYNDKNLFQHLRDNPIRYIIIINGPHHLVLNITLFSKLELVSSIYLLSVNRSVFE